MTKGALDQTLNDLVIMRGGRDSDEILLLDATHPALIVRVLQVAAAWANAEAELQRPWILTAFTQSILRETADCVDADPEDHEPQQLRRSLKQLIPFGDSHRLTVVSVSERPQDAPVTLAMDAPNQDHQLVTRSAEGIRQLGYRCSYSRTRDAVLNSMHVDIAYGTGDTEREQALDWDDFYQPGQYDQLGRAERLYLTFSSDPANFDAVRLGELVQIIPRIRREIRPEWEGYFGNDGDSPFAAS